MRELHLPRGRSHGDKSLAALHNLVLVLELDHRDMLVGSSQSSFELLHLGVFLVILAPQLDKLSHKCSVLVIQQLVVVLQIVVRPLIHVMLYYGLQLLELFLLLGLHVDHLNLILSFLLQSLLPQRSDLFLQLSIFLLDLFAVAFDGGPIFLAPLCLSLLGRCIV